MSLLEEAKKEGLSELQLNALMGTVLGDGCIRSQSQNTAFVLWDHSVKQKDYVNAKYQLLSGFVTRPPYEKPNPGYGDFLCILRTTSLTTLRLLYQMVYPNGRENGKRITQEYLNQITHPIALAWFYLDDGSRTTDVNSGSLAMCSYPLEDVTLFQKWLMDKWGMETVLQEATHSVSKHKFYLLRFNRDAFIKLSELISPYTPASMSYKVKLLMQKCRQCEKDMPLSKGDFCSEECRKKYYELHKTEMWLKQKEKEANYSEERKAEIRKRRRDQKREKFANMTEEEKEVVRDYKRKQIQKIKEDPESWEKFKQRRKDLYQEKLKDPESAAKVREAQKAYREKIKADPEKLAAQREYMRQYYKKRSEQAKKKDSGGTESEA